MENLVEKPKLSEAPSRFAALGRYVITPEVCGILPPLPYSSFL